MTIKKDTRRDLGKRLVNREKAVWEEGGWLIESNLRWVYTRVGMRQVTITDYFGLYDFLAAWPEGGIMALVQVSAKGEGDHKPPLGFWLPTSLDFVSPDSLATEPMTGTDKFTPGIYEVFVYYRKLKTHDPRSWSADRRWWVRQERKG